MNAYKVTLVYYLEAVDEVDARRQAVGLKKMEEPVEIHAVQLELRTERCDSCSDVARRSFAPSDMVWRRGEYLCLYCDVDKYPEEYPGLY